MWINHKKLTQCEILELNLLMQRTGDWNAEWTLFLCRMYVEYILTVLDLKIVGDLGFAVFLVANHCQGYFKYNMIPALTSWWESGKLKWFGRFWDSCCSMKYRISCLWYWSTSYQHELLQNTWLKKQTLFINMWLTCGKNGHLLLFIGEQGSLSK